MIVISEFISFKLSFVTTLRHIFSRKQRRRVHRRQIKTYRVGISQYVCRFQFLYFRLEKKKRKKFEATKDSLVTRDRYHLMKILNGPETIFTLFASESTPKNILSCSILTFHASASSPKRKRKTLITV